MRSTNLLHIFCFLTIISCSSGIDSNGEELNDEIVVNDDIVVMDDELTQKNEGIQKPIIDTIFSGNYYGEEQKSKKGISLGLTNENDLEENNGQWCFRSDKEYYFNIELHGIDDKATLKTVTATGGVISEIDTLKRTFKFTPPDEDIIININYSIESSIIEVERTIDKKTKLGYKETIKKIDGLFLDNDIQICKIK